MALTDRVARDRESPLGDQPRDRRLDQPSLSIHGKMNDLGERTAAEGVCSTSKAQNEVPSVQCGSSSGSHWVNRLARWRTGFLAGSPPETREGQEKKSYCCTQAKARFLTKATKLPLG